MSADVLPATVDWPLFDCVQVNLAVLADRWHGAGTHLNLGAVLRFRPAPGPGGLPTVERSAEEQITDAARDLGLAVLDRRTTPADETLQPAQGRYVIADAYHLPWVPYFGQRHMDHSFLLETAADGSAVAVDGYHNETPWGSARPVSHALSPAQLAAAVPGPALVVTLAPAGEPLTVPGPGLDLADEEATNRYVSAYAEHPDRPAALDRLTLETWLLARSRKLHARFLTARGLLTDEPAVTAHVKAWESLAESVYLGYRRVERGRPESRELSTRLADQLRRDREVFGTAPARAPGQDPDDRPAVPAALRERVAAVTAAVLRTDPAALLDGQPLAAVPGFTSFRVVEIVERLERELSLEFAADDLVPEHLHHIDGICRIVLRALPTGTAQQPARPAARTGVN
ncbi:acyl carrier protein [Streptomyces roseoverticillatus]|uniref:acyl carrier protein n=1 Tax=Streptomyces roseoverticillatus TaxID=66429 RepID=UPI001F484F21|nr:acyl carrier protein [Streptomyces roseoverticillatus]MCF3103090.1 acyl carrier protein [Streptomyces roseoverticillatus]